jgi:hypothetical protein
MALPYDFDLALFSTTVDLPMPMSTNYYESQLRSQYETLRQTFGGFLLGVIETARNELQDDLLNLRENNASDLQAPLLPNQLQSLVHFSTA